MKKSMVRKGLVIGIILLFIGTSVILSIGVTIGNLDDTKSRELKSPLLIFGVITQSLNN